MTMSRAVRASREEIDQIPDFPLIVPGFLSPAHVTQLLSFAEASDGSFGETDAEDYWRGRTLTASEISDEGVRSLFREIRDRIIGQVSALLADHVGPQPPLHSDLMNYARWPPGYELLPHADSENPNGAPHPYPWRDLAVVLYLNDNYEGGEIYFPNLDIEIKPTPGMLVVFPGTLFFLHGVRKVTAGMRHTIASFLTFDASRRYDF